MRSVGAFLVAALLLPGSALAQSGINLSWDDCGASGTEVKFFACDTNSGISRLFISAVPPEPMPQLNAVEFVIDIATSQPALSSWWQFQSGGCRAGSLTGQYDFTSGPFSCLDIWAGEAAGGINWTSGFNGPNRARLRGVAAVPGWRSADNSTEMYLFAVRFSHQKSTGAGSCEGCTDKACFVLNSVKLTQPLGVGDYVLTQPLGRSWAYWRCPGTFFSHGGGCSFFCSTPTARPTWGSIKTLYR